MNDPFRSSRIVSRIIHRAFLTPLRIYPNEGDTTMRRRLNLKWLAGSMVLLAVLAGCTHLLHGMQVRRNAGALLSQANRAEEQNDPTAARGHLERYLALAPTDADAAARLALLREQLASSRAEQLAAFFALEHALRLAPQRHDVRRQLVQVAMKVRRHTDAHDHLQVLLEAHPDDAEIEDLLAQCAEANAQFAQAADWCERSLRHAPGRIDGYVRHADLLRRRLNRPEDADRAMERLVNANADSAPAWLARARYRQMHGTFADAAADVAEAQRLAPANADVLLAASDLELARNRIDDARATLKRALEHRPADVRLLQAMARVELRAGRRSEALTHVRKALPGADADPQLLWAAADILIEAGETSEATVLLTRLDKAPLPRASLDFLHARICLSEERWAEACRLLEGTRAKLTGAPDLLKQTHLLLAHCYQHLGNPESQLAAFRAALDLDPTSQPAALGVAAATAAAGRLDEALLLCDKLGRRSPELRLFAARLLVARNLGRPVERRDWKEVERFLQDLPADMQKTSAWRLLWAELLVAQQRSGEAMKFLDAARADEPKQVEYRIMLAALTGAQKGADRAEAILDEAERDLGDSIDLRLARAALPAERPAKETRAHLSKLAQGNERLPKIDRVRLLQGLAKAAHRAGDTRLSRQWLAQIAELQPNDLEVRLSLLQQALAERDGPAAERLIQDIRRIEGESGSLWRFGEVALRLRLGRFDDLKECRKYLAHTTKARPHWAPVAVLDAELCEREGDLDGAIDQYRRAVQLGERQPLIVRRVVQLLQERRRYVEAQEVLRQLQEQGPLSADLNRLAAEVSFFSRRAPEETLALARKAVDADPKDHRNQLWLGQVLAALDKPADAEKAFRRAIELKPDAPDAWVALVLFLARSKQIPAAQETLAKATRDLGKSLVPLQQAICWEALGDRVKAQKQYAAALEAQPADAIVVRMVAVSHMRAGEFGDALPHLRKLLAVPVDDGTTLWTRRNLALALAAGGSYAAFKEALALVDQNLQRPNPAVEDQRIRALVLSTQPSRRRESIAVLEKSFTRAPASPEEQFLLARLWEADRNWPKARGQMLELLAATEGKNPIHLAYYVEALLRHQNADEAEVWLEKLAKLEPRTWRTLEVTARLRTQQGKTADAVALLRDRARANPDDELAAAVLLEQLGHLEAAEALYRQSLKTTKRTETALGLAIFLARRQKSAEALDLCEAAAADVPPETLGSIFVGIVRTAPADEASVKRAERWLTAAVAKKPQSTPLLLALADLRDHQGRFGDAQSLYRQVLERDPKNTFACNNLAVLLALQQKGREALDLSQRALDVAGPAPFLLDTRALVHLAIGQHQQAVTDLEEAIAQQPTGTRYFHLAQAHRAAKDRAAAGLALKKARSLGLTASALHPLERPAYEGLLAEHAD